MYSTIAIMLYYVGVKPKCSTLIDEDTITLGYGKLYCVGVWEYNLPPKYVKKILGATKWSELKKMKEYNN